MVNGSLAFSADGSHLLQCGFSISGLLEDRGYVEDGDLGLHIFCSERKWCPMWKCNEGVIRKY